MRFFPASIKWQMVMAISSVFAATILVFGGISLEHIRESHQMAADYQLALTQRIAADLDSRIEDTMASLQAVGNIAPPAVFQNPKFAKKWLDNRTGIKTVFFDRGLFLFDPTGKLLASSSSLPRLSTVPEFGKWVKKALQLEEPIISQPFWADAAQRHNMLLLVVTPVLAKDGRVLGAFAGAMDLNRETMLGSIARLQFGKTGYYFVISWDGSLMMHPDSSLLLRKDVHPVSPKYLERAAHGFLGTEETVAPSGEPVLASLVKLQSTGWVLGANQPTREAHAQLLSQQRDTFILIVLGLLVVAGITWGMMRMFVSPLKRLADDMGRIDAGGRQFENVAVPARGSEIARLANAFNGLLGRLNADRDEMAQAELDLRRLNETLEQRVQDEVARNREKDHLLIQQSRLAAMGEMVHNIAHQWRQPLNALTILLANIQDAYEYNELDRETLDGSVATGQQLIQNMSTTIDDFRNFFRPNTEMTRFLVQEALDEALALVHASFLDSRVTLHYERGAPVEVIGYKNELSQALLNLLANAKDALQNRDLKDGWVRVRVECGETIRISVSDNGSGIPAEILPKIFDPYFTTKDKGSGIGLYMSKMIVEKMNGEIEARNTAHGAEFMLTFPMAPPLLSPERDLTPAS